MAAKMEILFVPSTEHILAAAVRGNIAGAPPSAASLVGAGLLFRNPASGDTLITLPAEHLAVQSIDRRDDVLLTARRFVLVDGLPELASAPAATPPGPLQLNGTTITVNLAVAAPAGGSVVWVYIEGAAQPIVQRVQVPQASTVGTDPLLLPPGSYRALVLAPGHEPVALQETVP
jgi:hypothetical protein